jgi:UDP-N-acetylmuramoyl-tripeptide--D-alanyl-D-alanine ligase
MTLPLSERTVRAALGLPGGSPETLYRSVSTDSRTLQAGALFVALVGDRFDGHAFLAAARDAGAVAAVVRDDTPDVPGLTLHRVPDTLSAYGRLARARRQQIPGPVVAVTGTNGKTATKEMLAAVLGTRYTTWATRANLNNLVGVPQTILEAPEETEALVVEAGANQPGEIARYREIIVPDVAIVTNAAAGHLQGFGSTVGVMREKLELVRGVELALVGTDPPVLAEEARARGARTVRTVGLEGADITAVVSLTDEARPRVTVDDRTFTLPLLGRHQAVNALFAWGVAQALGLDLDAAARALEQVRLPAGRGEVIRTDGLLVVHDAYNANPASFLALIEVAEQLRRSRRLVFVVGTMLELGPASETLHREIAARLAALAPDLLAAVGEFVPALEPFAARLGSSLVTAPDVPTLGLRLAERLRGDEVVVLKASRGVALERILPLITARSLRTAPSTPAPSEA